MIQGKELKEIQGTLDSIGITEPGVWKDIKNMEHGVFIIRTMRSDTESVRITAELERNKNLGVYSFEGYEASVLPFPYIEHGVYAGIDTRELEKNMNGINWGTIIPSIHFHESPVRDVLQKCARLLGSGHRNGAEAGELLMLKHLSYTPLESFLTPIRLIDELEKKAFINVNNDNHDLDITDAVSVLSGRSVAKPLDAVSPGVDICWVVLEGEEIKKIPDFDLDGKAMYLPFKRQPDTAERAGIIADLSKGNRIEGQFNLHGYDFTALYQADPVNERIAMFDIRNRGLELRELQDDPAKVKELPERKSPKMDRGMKL
ncbi:hypothetical protein JHJ32_07320 [Parapedobacter sp. ISTM3]|uniref:hypothetical protein n=1 Tax=Parapedobacter sp. ISTM3 TaxID=2800130 RepID=UPI001906A5FA|nr:hypothetical protein [Parapedobacter sp. ISTM3]MBK1439787.1 hypothetical protein [Parapedobacter sp. ISTM3]